MMPGDALSSQAISSDLVFPGNLTREALVDYEMGGIALSDASMGLQYQVWAISYDGNTGDVICSPAVGDPVTLFTVQNITELSLAFDQNMNVFVAYVVDDAQAWYFWYDPIEATYLHQIMSADVTHPRCTLDDKRPALVNSSDIILAYTKEPFNDLAMRQQRDRYEVEYPLRSATVGRFDKVAMGKNSRLHFVYLTSPSDVVEPSPLNKLQVVENFTEQGYLDLGGWSAVPFSTEFSPNTLLGVNFTQQVACDQLDYLTYANGGGAYGFRIKDAGDCAEAELVHINHVTGKTSGSVTYRTGYGDSPTLPFYNSDGAAIILASDTGTVTVEKVTL